MRRLNASAGLALALGIILLTTFTGNADAIDPWNIQDSAAAPAGALNAAHTVGQTFRAHAARLCAIQVRWIAADDLAFAPASQVTLHLRHRVDDPTDVATATLALADLRNNAYGKFVFAPIADSADTRFYFFIDSANAQIQRGLLSVWASAQDAYPNGQAYLDGQPTSRDLVFRAFYEPDAALLWQALGDALSKYHSTILWAALVIFFPGLILLFVGGEAQGKDFADGLSLAVGLGLATLSTGAFLLLGWDALAHTWGVYLFLFGALLVAGLGLVYRRRKKIAVALPVTRATARLELPALALLVLAALAAGVALLQIRDVRAPLWVDSPTHASYIAQLVNQAQMPLERFYHLGYHAIVALVVRLSGVAIPDAMLLIGQLLIVQTGLSVFLLSRRLSHSALAGLASAVAVWFLSPTPAYFVTWGRYPLLLGGALLPVAMLAALNLIDRARLEPWTIFFAGVTFVGLAFAQVRLVVFYFAFVLAFAANYFWKQRRNSNARQLLNRMALLGSSGVGVAMFWVIALSAHGSSWQAILGINAGAPLIDVAVAWEVVSSHHGIELMALAIAALAVGWLRRSPLVITVSTWYSGVGVCALIAESGGGRPYFESSLVVLMGFLPASLVVGELAQRLSDSLTLAWRTHKISATAVSVLLIALVGLAGVKDMLQVINPATLFYFDADQTALPWIDEHLPGDAKFLINSFAWFDSNYVPADGGAWLPYKAGRAVDFIATDALTISGDATKIAQWMTERQIAYIYLGRRAGILSPATLLALPERFTLIYDRAGVRIFQLQNSSGAGG